MNSTETTVVSHIPFGRMSRAELTQWFDSLMLRLEVLRGANAPRKFRSELISSLLRFGFTQSHAKVAETWLIYGKWDAYRKAGVVYVNDFLPTSELLHTIHEGEIAIARAANKIVADLARKNYLHRKVVAQMLEEVELATRIKVERELRSEREGYAALLMRCSDLKGTGNFDKKQRSCALLKRRVLLTTLKTRRSQLARAAHRWI